MAQRQDVDDGIADATLALLRTKGPRSVTVEAVAERSGIAKTTIYRRTETAETCCPPRCRG